MKKALLFPLLAFIALCGCAKNESRDDELVYLRTIMPASLLEYAHVEVGSLQSIAIKGKGQAQHLGLRISPGENKVHGGLRAEVSVDYPFRQGETIRYSWRFMLPKEFVSDAPKNRWWVIGQWHDQPNIKLNQTWENFASHSPPILLGLGELKGKLAITLTCGPTNEKRKSRTVGPVFIERGKWHHIAVEILWSRKTNGKVSVILNGLKQPAMTAKGPNMNNDYQHYWKLGMYRHPEIATDNWIYLDDLKISRNPLR